MEQRNSIKKIAIIGAESTGKSELCEALAKHYNTVFVPEYAREYFNDSDIYNYTLDDLIIIAKKQIELENEWIKRANKFLFCDTTLITLKIWAELEFQKTPPFIEEHLLKQDYDYYFITNNDVPWTPDPLRQNKYSRDLLFEMNVAEVKKINVAHSIISGIGEERVRNAVGVLKIVAEN